MAALENKKAVLFLGLPGSGKTTQAVRLSDSENLLHLTTSRIIRDKFRNTPIGEDQKIDIEREPYNAGHITNPELVAEWVKEAISQGVEKWDGVILDGSPRTKDELDRLIPFLEELFGEENLFPIHLVVEPEIASARIAARFICVSCEKAYTRENYIAEPVCQDLTCEGELVQKLVEIVLPDIIPILQQVRFAEIQKLLICLLAILIANLETNLFNEQPQQTTINNKKQQATTTVGTIEPSGEGQTLLYENSFS